MPKLSKTPNMSGWITEKCVWNDVHEKNVKNVMHKAGIHLFLPQILTHDVTIICKWRWKWAKLLVFWWDNKQVAVMSKHVHRLETVSVVIYAPRIISVFGCLFSLYSVLLNSVYASSLRFLNFHHHGGYAPFVRETWMEDGSGPRVKSISFWFQTQEFLLIFSNSVWHFLLFLRD